MSDPRDYILEEMQTLYNASRLTKRAHFIASQRKKRMHAFFGIGVIILNIMIFSPIFDLIFPSNSAVIIKFLAIISASFAGAQTFFNFQKNVESHQNAGDIYGNINRRLGDLLAEYKQNNKEVKKALIKEYKKMEEEYLRANDANKAGIPSDKDFDNARKAIEKKDKKNKKMKSD